MQVLVVHPNGLVLGQIEAALAVEGHHRAIKVNNIADAQRELQEATIHAVIVADDIETQCDGLELALKARDENRLDPRNIVGLVSTCQGYTAFREEGFPHFNDYRSAVKNAIASAAA